MLSLLAAVALVAASDAAAPVLNPQQASALRCGVVFALGARMQSEGVAQAAGWPPLGTRGKEYFVRVTARLMDETGASRDALAGIAMQQIPALEGKGAVSEAMSQCLPLLDAAGL
jgi:hypothetical protein